MEFKKFNSTMTFYLSEDGQKVIGSYAPQMGHKTCLKVLDGEGNILSIQNDDGEGNLSIEIRHFVADNEVLLSIPSGELRVEISVVQTRLDNTKQKTIELQGEAQWSGRWGGLRGGISCFWGGFTSSCNDFAVVTRTSWIHRMPEEGIPVSFYEAAREVIYSLHPSEGEHIAREVLAMLLKKKKEAERMSDDIYS